MKSLREFFFDMNGDKKYQLINYFNRVCPQYYLETGAVKFADDILTSKKHQFFRSLHKKSEANFSPVHL